MHLPGVHRARDAHSQADQSQEGYEQFATVPESQPFAPPLFDDPSMTAESSKPTRMAMAGKERTKVDSTP